MNFHVARITQKNQVFHAVILSFSRKSSSFTIFVMDTQFFRGITNLALSTISIIDFIPIAAKIAFIQSTIIVSDLFFVTFCHDDWIGFQL